MRRSLCPLVSSLVVALTLCTTLYGTPVPAQPPPPGEVRVICAEAMRPIVEHWVTASRELAPSVRFTVQIAGSDVALANLYCGRCELALVGRAATAPELKAFEWVYHYPAARCELMTGAWNQPGQSPAVGIVASAANPLTQLALPQLAAALGARSETEAPATWQALGLTGPAGHRLIHFYLPDTESGTGRYFRAAVLDDSRKLKWDQSTEFDDSRAAGLLRSDATEKILRALAADPDGLAIVGLPPVLPTGTKLVAVASFTGRPAVVPTAQTVADRSYPLGRPVFGYYNRQASGPLSPGLRELLRYALSSAGQAEIAPVSHYAALPPTLHPEPLLE